MTVEFIQSTSILPRHDTSLVVIGGFSQSNANTTTDSATLSWTSSQAKVFSVGYRITGTQGGLVSIDRTGIEPSTSHTLTLTGLPLPNTSYDVVVSSDSVSAVFVVTTKPVESLDNFIVVDFPAADGSTVLDDTSLLVEWSDLSFISTVGYDVLIRPDFPFNDQFSTTGVIFDSNGLGAQQDTSGQNLVIPRDGRTYHGIVIANFRGGDGVWQDTQEVLDQGRFGLFSFKAAEAIAAPVGSETQQLITILDDLVGISKSRLQTASSWKDSIIGAYNARNFTNGMHMAWVATGKTEYVQHAVDIALHYIDAGEDLVGPGNSDNKTFQKDGYLDWRIGSGYPAIENNINYYHYEYALGQMVAYASLALREHGGIGITPTNAQTRIGDFLRKHIWEKWEESPTSSNSNVGSIYTLTNSSSAWFNARITHIAIALAQFEPNPNSNKYVDVVNNVTSILNSNMIANGGWSELKYKTTEPAVGSEPGDYIPTDVSHHKDVISALMVADKYNLGTVSTALKAAITSNADNNLYPASRSNAVWKPIISTTNWSYPKWDGFGAYWGPHAYYMSPANLQRLRSDYLAVYPQHSSHRYLDVQNIGALLASESRGFE